MSFEVEYFKLTATDSSNRYVILNGTPVSASNVALDTVSGTSQALTYDFAVDSTKIKWDDATYNLYNQLSVDDRIRIIYDRS